MSKQSNLPNLKRRRVIQGAVLTSAAVAVPGIASAVCGSGAHKLSQAKNNLTAKPTLTNSDISIDLFETDNVVRNGKLARISITNKSDRAVKIAHISPGAISTQKGVYQINARLSDNPLAIRPGGTYQFWLTPDDGTQAKLSVKPKPTNANVHMPFTVEVSVRTNLDTGPWSGTQRVQALIA